MTPDGFTATLEEQLRLRTGKGARTSPPGASTPGTPR
jgi:hypothetical protein